MFGLIGIHGLIWLPDEYPAPVTHDVSVSVWCGSVCDVLPQRCAADLSGGERSGDSAGRSQQSLCGHEPEREALRICECTNTEGDFHTVHFFTVIE